MKTTLKLSKDSIFHMQRGKIVAYLTFASSVLILYACFLGIFDKSIYRDVVSAGTITNFLRVGSVAQDIIFIPLAILLAVLSVVFLIRPGYKIFITMLGLSCNFFYGYGLYAMQGQYTSIYLLYLVIFSMSIYSIIFGLLSFKPGFAEKISMPNRLRISIFIFLLIIVLMLGLVWIMRVSADITKHIPQDTYGVFVLDLGIVFPAIAITAIQLIRKKPFGTILAGVALFKTVTICLSWGFGELYGRLEGTLTGGYEMLALPTVLTFISLTFFVLYILKLKTNK